MQIEKKAIVWQYRSLLKKDGEMEKGEHEIRIRLTHYKSVKYISIGYSSSINNWDMANGVPLPSHPKLKKIIKRIDEIMDDVDFELRLAEKNHEEHITIDEVKKRVLKKSDRPVGVKMLALCDTVIAEMEAQGRIGYADVFKNCRATIKKLLNDNDKHFTSFTRSDAENYENLLVSTCNKQTTISNYLRTFYRLWNIAIDRGFCPKEYHPSKYIRFKPYKKLKTTKRAIKFEDIIAIESLKYEYQSRIFRSQQYFLFSYYTRGINFVDLAKLKWGVNVRGCEVAYSRSKNKREYDFIMHSKSKKIVELFRSYPIRSDDNYVFPILNSQHNTPKKIDVRVDSALKDLNEDLKVMGRAIGLERELTSYVARHSFATNLKQKKVDVSFIQEALGHETELQTRTYLEQFDDVLLAESIEQALS